MTPIACQGSGYSYKFSQTKLSDSATEQERTLSASLGSTSPESRDLPDGLGSE